ncbi:MAG: Phosphate transport system permease protein PstC, partial [Planctomycetota bacterium]
GSLREASYALGATKFETSTKIVVPAALSGILASFLLAISRAIGETMAVTLACGGQPKLTLDPREGLATMTGFIARIAQGDVQHGTTLFNSLFAVAAVLFIITLTMNMLAQWILTKYRQVYQ